MVIHLHMNKIVIQTLTDPYQRETLHTVGDYPFRYG